jgi:hypothetical protein
MRVSFSSSTTLLFCFLALALVACSDSTAPSDQDPADGAAVFDATIDPTGSTFVLQSIDDPVPGHRPIYIDLIGSNVEIDPSQQTVSIDVSIRNRGREWLYAPATIWLNHFVPPEVSPLNADYVRDGTDPSNSDDLLGSYGFDYAELLGEDGALEPNETSQARTWTFHDPGLISFSFAAQAEFGIEPDRPVISGMLFTDVNRNGIRDPDEGPYHAGGVSVRFPDGSTVGASPDARGSYRVRVTQPGLYRVTFVSMLACPACYCETTPNPLEVFLTPGPKGEPSSFEHADFGIYPGPCFDPPPPGPLGSVMLTDLPAGEIDQDPYDFLGANLEGEIFNIRVGYGGCAADHPFTLYAARGFMESMPVQTWTLLSHDDRDEPCEVYFLRTRSFDLGPIQEAHIQDYGEPGIVGIRFRDFEGNETVFRLVPDVVTLTGVVTRISDDVPVDGDVVLELLLDSGDRAKVFLGSFFTATPAFPWRMELYQLIKTVEIGDRVTANARRATGGLALHGLTILDN